MLSDDIASYVRKRVSDNHVVVSRPDHPNMLIAPDVLIGGEGRMSAIFVARRGTSIAQLRARLICARLVLPIHARMLLFLSSNRGIPFDLEGSFDEIVRPSQRKLLLPSSKDHRTTGAQLKALIDVRRRNDIRAAAILQIVSLRDRQLYSGKRTKTLTRALAKAGRREESSSRVAFELRPRKKSPLVALVAGSVVTPVSQSGGSYRQRLAPVWKAGLVGTFSLDDGVPYASSLQPHVALVESALVSRFDTAKPRRACAYAGWALISSDSPEDVTHLVERLQSFYERLA